MLPVLVPLVVVGVEARSGAEEQTPVLDERARGLKESSNGGGPTGVEWLILGMLAGLPSALFLGWRLRRRAYPLEPALTESR